jgi:hypothetical protein
MNAATALLHLMLMERLHTDKYKVYGSTGEGSFFHWGDSDIEESSGYVALDDGKAYYYWISWDHEAQKPGFCYWEEVPKEEIEWVKANVA